MVIPWNYIVANFMTATIWIARCGKKIFKSPFPCALGRRWPAGCGRQLQRHSVRNCGPGPYAIFEIVGSLLLAIACAQAKLYSIWLNADLQ